jgi:hypothetical protein
LLVFVLGLSSTYERKHVAFWLSEPGQLHSRWCSPVPSIYLQMKESFILLYGWKKFHCI